MAIVFVGGQSPLAGGGDEGDVYIFLDPSANINFTGLLTVPDQVTTNRSTRIANTRFVHTAIEAANGSGDGVGGGVGLWVGANPPENPITHPFWFDDTVAQLFVNDGTTWVIAVNPPAGTGGGSSDGFDSVNASVTALPGGQGAAATLGSQISLVTAGTGGVRWDAPQPGDHRFVHNATTAAITFYPPSGAQINSLAANAGVFIQPNMTGFVKAVSSARLITVP